MRFLAHPSRLPFLLAAVAPGVPQFDLSQLYLSTVETSDAYLSKAEERNQIQETRSQANGALLPTVNAVGTHARNDRPAGGTTAALAPASQTNVRLTGRQFLFRGGSEYAFLSQTSTLMKAVDAELEASRQSYYLSLANLYFETLLRQAEVNHARTEVELND